jgi:hypothetical protein
MFEGIFQPIHADDADFPRGYIRRRAFRVPTNFKVATTNGQPEEGSKCAAGLRKCCKIAISLIMALE